jgi:cytochrome c oxidase cbb3-type subunit IV
MSPLWGPVAGAMIILMMLSFIGIWIWSWNSRHKPVFDQLAQLPMEDDAHGVAAQEDRA